MVVKEGDNIWGCLVWVWGSPYVVRSGLFGSVSPRCGLYSGGCFGGPSRRRELVWIGVVLT